MPSTELNSLIRKLDSRDTGEPGRAGQYAKKKRVLSIPSQKPPPKEAPFWSVVGTADDIDALDTTPQRATHTGASNRRNISSELDQ